MNLALANIAAAAPRTAVAGAAAKGPLADFLALFENLGVSLDDGDTALQLKTAARGSKDVAARLLARLSAPSDDPDASDAGKSPEDKLAALLASFDKDSTGEDPAAATPDIARLLSLAAAIAARAEPAPPTPGSAVTAGAAAAATPTIIPFAGPVVTDAAAGGGPAPVVPDNQVQSAFARLAQLLGAEVDAGVAGDTALPAAPPAPAATASADPDGKDQLADLLARLTAMTRAPASAGSPRLAPGELVPGGQAGRRAAAAMSATSATPVLPATSATPALPAAPAAQALPVQAAAAVQPTAGGEPAPLPGPLPVSPLVDTTLPPVMLVPAPVADMPAAAQSGGVDTTAQPLSELVMRHHLDLARDSQWLDTLARDIARAAQHESQLRFQLNPEHLGSLKVELVNGAQGTSVKLTADTEAARAILADAQPRLLAEARAQGLRISEAQVDLGGHGHGARHQPETPVIIRTSAGVPVAEIQQEAQSASSERYA